MVCRKGRGNSGKKVRTEQEWWLMERKIEEVGLRGGKVE